MHTELEYKLAAACVDAYIRLLQLPQGMFRIRSQRVLVELRNVLAEYFNSYAELIQAKYEGYVNGDNVY